VARALAGERQQVGWLQRCLDLPPRGFHALEVRPRQLKLRLAAMGFAFAQSGGSAGPGARRHPITLLAAFFDGGMEGNEALEAGESALQS
jgi:hypothetical protein